ncbi:MAG: hypothetical protein HN742_07655 [Lentisphaerae bacterium]|nr:hypothetical protein [Lentisphaerota bacterium]MBT4822700.1 hypothetical protein [Lentisphaerota bacterium]MBT5606179.1 hypothetical protein [Lentisphaerota bacterium]MBT7057875.1 hypothetical protein [Lentisphaerota bacterium]MBT7841731.1 hypothetical protein [Lentisphaerota bacterium]
MQQLFRLNPDIPSRELDELFSLARETDSTHFSTFVPIMEDLLQAYLECPAKRVERLTLEEYFAFIKRSTRLLAEAGELSAPPEKATADAHSVALIDPQVTASSLDWCKIVSHAAIPKPVILAAEACQQRNELLSSVLEYAFRILQSIDLDKALAWQLAYLEDNRGDLDPDIVRDLLRAWLDLPTLPNEAFEWAETWSGDENLRNQWPHVVRLADRLLHLHALMQGQPGEHNRSSSLQHLQLILKRFPRDEKRLLRWFENAIIEIGESVHFFVTIHTHTDADWQAAALLKEIRTIETLFPPVLVLADLIVHVPNGASRFALAFFGLVGSGREKWDQEILTKGEMAVRRQFLRNMRREIGPEKTIEALCFGDGLLYNKLMGELDWLTKDFDSLRQRDKVVQALAITYTSFREGIFLATEVSKRFRDLMRVVHEDNLRRVLPPEVFEEVSQLKVLRTLATLAADARRCLAKRRALETDLESMVAADLDFIQSVRRQRLALIHSILGGQEAS